MSTTGEPIEPLYVTRLVLRGYRRFEDLYLVPQALTVLIGINGAGKTAVLQSMAVALSRLTTHITNGRASGLHVSDADIRRGQGETSIMLNLALGDREFVIGVVRTKNGRQRAQYLPEVPAVGPGGDGKLYRSRPFKELGEEVRRRLTEQESASVPVIALYSVNRAVLEVPLRVGKKHEFDQVSVYEGAYENQRSFRAFFEWFRAREDLENESLRDGESNRDRELDAVRQAVERFMPGYRNLRVRRSPLRMTLDKGDETLLVTQLSDGERALLSVVGDLARRLAIANPGLADPLQGIGIVMIDEIELHLHPLWQRHAVQMLPKVFPSLQFILTTHSAVVANSAPRDALLALRDGKVEKVEAYGQDVAVVLADIFGTEPRPERVQEQIDGIFRALEEDPNRAEGLIRELESEIPPQDEALVRARARLARRR